MYFDIFYVFDCISILYHTTVFFKNGINFGNFSQFRLKFHNVPKLLEFDSYWNLTQMS
jgi:hypothetical protein